MANNDGLPKTEQGSTLIHAAVPNSATILDTLATILGVYHAVLDLANAFLIILLTTESQEQFSFTCKGQQCNFQLLPQGYLHSPTMLWDSSSSSFSVLLHISKNRLITSIIFC